MRRLLGFSLIELLAVLAIVVIIASISYPLYSSHVIKARRHHAEAALVSLAQRLEEYYSLEDTYKNSNKLVEEFNVINGYKLIIRNPNDEHFTISAVPSGDQAKRDRQCGTLSLNDRGQRSVSGHGSAQSCWL